MHARGKVSAGHGHGMDFIPVGKPSPLRLSYFTEQSRKMAVSPGEYTGFLVPDSEDLGCQIQSSLGLSADANCSKPRDPGEV